MITAAQHIGIEKFTKAYNKIQESIFNTPFWSEFRKESFQKFEELGIPTNRHEDWKYTAIQNFLKFEFEESPIIDFQFDKNKYKIDGLEKYDLVFVDGVYKPEISDALFDTEIQVMDIQTALERSTAKENLGKYAENKYHFVALNNALFDCGYCIEIPKNYQEKKAIHIIQIFTGNQSFQIQQKNLIKANSFSELTIIETFEAENLSQKIFYNAVTEVVLAENAKVLHLKTQNTNSHFISSNFTQVQQHKSSNYNNHTYTFEGLLTRNNLNVAIDGVNAECHLYGLYVGKQNQLIDNHTIVDHKKPNCQSNEWYKGVLYGESKGVFNGKIFVRPDAQKTNAFQQNNNILMSDFADINTKPELEIYADDVKCSHGSTTGQFDEEAVFYLRARGISENSARQMLVHAFAHDVTEKMENEILRNFIAQLIDKKLAEI